MSLKVTNKTWLISDTHFGHKGIEKFLMRPATHEVIILSNWVERIRDDDVVLHLGDVFMGKQGNPHRWAKIVSRMPGKKYLIMGNHDEFGRELYESAGFEIISPFIQDEYLFSHEPASTVYHRPLATSRLWDINVHGHVHAQSWSLDHDGYPIEGKKYINVNVDHTRLYPVQFGALKNKKDVFPTVRGMGLGAVGPA